MPRKSPSVLVMTLISLVVLLLVASFPSAYAADTCSSSSPCSSSSSPCCSHSGFCGSGTLFCGGGCNPLASKTATDCLPMPVCVDRNVTLTPDNYNDTSLFVPVLQYAGNASQGLFTLDAGSLAAGPEGVMLQMTENSLVKLSTTAYNLYGEMEVTCRHTAYQGVVATMITMSDVLDEIDWEFTTNDTSTAQTNWFPQGRTVSGSGKDSKPASGTLDVSQWVTYGINWQPDALQWLINGTVVRTLKRTDYNYPSTPTRLQLSVWAGGNSTNAQGVIDWSGDPISYTDSQYTTNGYYGMEISFVSIKCADTSIANVSTIGKGTDGPTSWTYTGVNDSSTNNVPAFVLNTDPITFLDDPSAGGVAGDPGYKDQNTALPTGGWDGSGDTGVRATTSSSSASSKAKKYGIPIAVAVVVLILLWGAIVAIVRRRRRYNRRPKTSTPLGGIGPNSYSNVPGEDDGKLDAAGFGSKYIPLREDVAASVPVLASTSAWASTSEGRKKGSAAGSSRTQEPSEKIGSDYPAAPPVLPMGAEMRGTGIGPASGPVPSNKRGGGGAYSQLNSTAPGAAYGSGYEYGYGQQQPSRAGGAYGEGRSPLPQTPLRQQQQQQQAYDAPQYSDYPARVASPAAGSYYSPYPQQQQQQQQQQRRTPAASPYTAQASPYPGSLATPAVQSPSAWQSPAPSQYQQQQYQQQRPSQAPGQQQFGQPFDYGYHTQGQGQSQVQGQYGYR